MKRGGGAEIAAVTASGLDNIVTTPEQRREAGLYVLGIAHDAADARLLLAALGLTPDDLAAA